MDAIVHQPSRKNHFPASAPIQFDFDFFDLEIIPGLYANGTAEIAVHADGVNDDPEYFIGRIFLHGEQNKLEPLDDSWAIEGETLSRKIFLAIFDALDTGSLSEKVKDRMVEEMEKA